MLSIANEDVLKEIQQLLEEMLPKMDAISSKANTNESLCDCRVEFSLSVDKVTFNGKIFEGSGPLSGNICPDCSTLGFFSFFFSGHTTTPPRRNLQVQITLSADSMLDSMSCSQSSVDIVIKPVQITITTDLGTLHLTGDIEIKIDPEAQPLKPKSIALNVMGPQGADTFLTTFTQTLADEIRVLPCLP